MKPVVAEGSDHRPNAARPANGAHCRPLNGAQADELIQAPSTLIEDCSRPGKGQPTHAAESSNKNRAMRDPSSSDEVSSAILRVFTKRQKHSKAKEPIGMTILLLELKKEMPISDAALVPVLAEMVRAGVLVQTGEGRGARYQRP